MKRTISIVAMSFLLQFGIGSSALAGDITTELQAAIDTAHPDEPIPVIIRLAESIDLKKYTKDPDKALRRSKLIRALKVKTDDGQKSLKKFLKDNDIDDKDIEVLWLINGVAVTLPASLIRELAARADVESIGLDAEVAEQAGEVSTSSSTPEWNIAEIRAPELWARGHNGSGVVVATMDSGVDFYHPDIGPKWRGGANSWYDPNGQHATPYDKTGHGTMVMGLIVGGDAGGTAIGVAPGAQWIAVKIFDDRGRSRLSRIHLGFQWILDPDGNPESNDAADIINNSWYLGNTVDQCNTEFADDIATLNAADIALVFSAGNTGPYTDSSVSPSNNPGSLAVGAVDEWLYVAGFSGRGPSACSVTTYPELVAPGVSVRTADRTSGGVFPNSYTSVSGTSFAAPHISAAMALLLSVNRNLTVPELKSALKLSTWDLGMPGEDNDSGYGLIDVMEAYMVLAGDPVPPVTADDNYETIEGDTLSVTPPGVLFNDSDGNGDLLTALLNTPPSNGSLSLQSDGSFVYTPTAGYTGADTFTYAANDGELIGNTATVTITVVPVPMNHPPTANNDLASTKEGEAVVIDVLANDSDSDGDPLIISMVSQGYNGSVDNNGHEVTYTPDPFFHGTDSFTYTASDGEVDSNMATVSITVNPTSVNSPPLAINDSASTKKNTQVTINVIANDTDSDGSIDVATVSVNQPNKGAVVSNGNGTVTFTPKKGFQGIDNFTYTVKDNEGAVSNAAMVSVDVSR